MRPRFLTRPATALLLCVAALALGGCGGGSDSFPSDPQHLVTGDAQSADTTLALGLEPVATFGGDPGWEAALDSVGSGMRRLEVPPATGNAVNVLSARDPDAIVAGAAWRQNGFDDDLARIAPTLYLEPAAIGTSPWRVPLETLAGELGREDEAARIAATLETRAAALRPRVEGKTVAVIRLAAPTSFSASGDFVPTSLVYERDLGLRNFHFKDQQYPYGCTAAPTRPKACRTNNLYAGLTGFMSPVDALLVETGWVAPSAAKAFFRDAQVRAMPAVKAGRVAESGSFTELGPLGVAHLYSSIARAFGLDESHAALGSTAQLSLVLDRRRPAVCWALRTDDADAIRGGLALQAGSKGQVLTDALAPDADGRAHGCTRVAEPVAAALLAGKASVAAGRVSGKLEPGAPSVVAAS